MCDRFVISWIIHTDRLIGTFITLLNMLHFGLNWKYLGFFGVKNPNWIWKKPKEITYIFEPKLLKISCAPTRIETTSSLSRFARPNNNNNTATLIRRFFGKRLLYIRQIYCRQLVRYTLVRCLRHIIVFVLNCNIIVLANIVAIKQF